MIHIKFWIFLGVVAHLSFTVLGQEEHDHGAQAAQPEGRTTMTITQLGPQIAEALIREAEKFNAPFAETSIRRLNADFFVQRKSTRFTNVVIYNTSNKPFQLKEHKCGSGRFTAPMLPEWEIRQHSSTTYGVESHGFMTGCTNCEVTYQTPDGQSYFTVYTSNPFIGGNHAGSKDARGVQAQTITSGGNKNIVQFRIY